MLFVHVQEDVIFNLQERSLRTVVFSDKQTESWGRDSDNSNDELLVQRRPSLLV